MDDDESGSDSEAVKVPEDDEYELDTEREAADEEDIEEIIKEVASEQILSDLDRSNGQYAVTKVCTSICLVIPYFSYRNLQLLGLAKRAFHSPTIREDLKACCVAAEITPKQMKRAVATRWNSLAEAIHRALYLRKALDRLVSLTKYDKPKKNGGLRRYRLSDDEWTILTQLYEVLKVNTLFVLVPFHITNIVNVLARHSSMQHSGCRSQTSRFSTRSFQSSMYSRRSYPQPLPTTTCFRLSVRLRRAGLKCLISTTPPLTKASCTVSP